MYPDQNATTPMDLDAVAAMIPRLEDVFGIASLDAKINT